MVKIRLMRIGAKKRPFYRVVVVDERAKRTGAYIELLGTYNPLTEPKEIHLKQDRIDYWIKQGAKPSDGYLRIIGKAPQRPPRKPKKSKQSLPSANAERKQVTGDSEQVKTEEVQISEGEVKPGADSQLSEAGEVSSESTSSDVHEPDQAGSESAAGGEEAKLENQDQTNEPSTKSEEPEK